MTTINLGQVQGTIADALDLVQRDMASLAGVQSSNVALAITLSIATSAGDVYPLAIKIERSDAVPGMPYHFKTSHFAKTPDQVGPYRTSRPYEDTVQAALHKGISTVKAYIDQAIKNGHRFKDDWLVANPAF